MLKPLAFGVTLGLFVGILCGIFMAVSVATGYGKEMFDMFGPMHPMYSFTYVGALWIAVLHFIALFVVGSLFATVYNRLAK